MNDIVVFGVGVFVSILVVFGLFTKVVQEMSGAKARDEAASNARKDSGHQIAT